MKFSPKLARATMWLGAVFLAACGPGGSTPNSAQVEWLTSIPEAINTARLNNRMILIALVGSDWSAASQGAMSEIFNTETFKTFADNNLVLLRLDYPRDKTKVPDETAKANAEWARMLQLDSLPTFALIDPRGGLNLFMRVSGYSTLGPDQFVQYLNAYIQHQIQAVAPPSPQAPATNQGPPILAPGQQNAPGLSGMPSAQDLMRQRPPQVAPLPGPAPAPTGDLVPSNLPAPDQLMEQMRPAAPAPGPVQVMPGMPSPADLMKQVAPAPSPTAPTQPTPPASSGKPADTTQPMFNLNSLK